MFTTCREWHPLCLKLSSAVCGGVNYLPGEYFERQPGSTANLIPRLPPSLSPTRGTLGKKLVPLLVYVSQLPTNHCYIARLTWKSNSYHHWSGLQHQSRLRECWRWVCSSSPLSSGRCSACKTAQNPGPSWRGPGTHKKTMTGKIEWRVRYSSAHCFSSLVPRSSIEARNDSETPIRRRYANRPAYFPCLVFSPPMPLTLAVLVAFSTARDKCVGRTLGTGDRTLHPLV